MANKKKTTNATDTIYVLELVGDPKNAGGSVTFEIAGISTDRSLLEKLKVEKDKWLDDYLGDGGGSDDDEDEEDDNFEDEGEYVLYNTDISSRPEWIIDEHKLLK